MPPKRKQAADASTSSSSSTPVFDDVVFAISGTISTTQAVFKKKVEDNGGSFASSVTKKVTHLVTTDEDVENGSAKTKKAQESGLFLVSEAFVDESIAAGKKLDEAKYAISAKAADAEKKADKKEEEAPKRATRGAAKKKAAKDDEEEEEEEEEKTPPPKKAKKDDDAKPAAEEKKEGKKETITIKGRAAVDKVSGHSSDCHVLQEGDAIYDAMLNQTNIAQNNNKFYVIQVLEGDNGNSYYTWNRWGRVGETGQHKLQPHGSKASAILDFKKKFTEKTKNRWENRASFEPVHGKYTLIEIDYGNDEEPEEAPKKKDKGKEKIEEKDSALDRRVQNLIKLIFDLKMMENTMKEMEFDVEKQPLGKLTKKQVKDGYTVLQQIETAIKDKASGAKLAELSSKFYTLIPHAYSRSNVPPPIKDSETLKKKMQMLEALADIEIATKLLKSSDNSDLNKIDANYKQLNCDITPVDEGSEEWKTVEEYVKNTHQNNTPKIKHLYVIDRQGEKARFDTAKHLGNRKLLWHGSRLTNYVGIISQGLRIAPPEAPASGYRFGKGVYFADIASLSSIYCRSAGSNDFCMLLADVALGKEKEVERDTYMEKAMAGFHSTKALGTIEPNPTQYASHPDGYVIPSGKIIPSKHSNVSCREHQYIVYDVAQCNLKYLIHLNWT